MPLYEYKCDKCGKVFEKIQKFSDEPLSVHDTCGGQVHRLISASSFQLKGSGWYATDYAKGGNGSTKKDSETKKAPDTAAKTDSKPSESKPAESKPAASDKSKTD